MTTRLAWFVGICMLLSGSALADPPSFTKMFRKKPPENASAQALKLQMENGPWMIMAYAFEGENSQAQAAQLANELRTTYKLRAYIHQKSFDHNERITDARGRTMKARNANQSTLDYYAVLVGDFTSAENPAYEEALRVLKFAKPKSLGGDGSNPGAKLKGTWADIKKVMKSNSEIKLEPGKMRVAIGTSNPLLPEDFTQPPLVDKFVKQMNSEVEHSLLENPKRFTVRVATFKGMEITVAKQSEDLKLSEESETPLERAAVQANNAVRLLRLQGIEAYQFHDRNSSIVTVGSFDSIGGNDAEGRFSYDPAITKTMATFGGTKASRGQFPVPKSLFDVVNYRNVPELMKGSEGEKMKLVEAYSIPFDLVPTVMAVPRAEAKSLYSGSLLGKR